MLYVNQLQSFLSVGTDGDIWIWTGDELDEAEYYPKNIKGRTHCAIAWHVRTLNLFYPKYIESID